MTNTEQTCPYPGPEHLVNTPKRLAQRLHVRKIRNLRILMFSPNLRRFTTYATCLPEAWSCYTWAPFERRAVETVHVSGQRIDALGESGIYVFCSKSFLLEPKQQTKGKLPRSPQEGPATKMGGNKV